MQSQMFPRTLGLKAGDWVEVRSQDELLSTLDFKGRLDELPLMPQMLAYAGKRFKVRSRAHKLCDTANSTGGRGMSNAVFLEDLRCDGNAYDGCEMRCSIIWKEAWLKRVAGPSEGSGCVVGEAAPSDASTPGHSGCAMSDVLAATRAPLEQDDAAGTRYVCQATQLPRATTPLPRWSLKQYYEDYVSGNARASEISGGLAFILYEKLVGSGLGFGAALRWLYDAFQQIRGGSPYPSRMGCLPNLSRTPSVTLNLQVGELVRVKSHREILKTVDEQLRNRGMAFHGEMVPHCGKVFRVHQRVGKIINERTGQMMSLKNECLVLDGADCVGKYTNPLRCPRACYPYWREIWLERVDSVSNVQATSGLDRK